MSQTLPAYWELFVFIFLSGVLCLWLLVRAVLLWRAEQGRWKQVQRGHREQDEYLVGYDARPVRPNVRRA
jgi:hypothetical protein